MKHNETAKPLCQPLTAVERERIKEQLNSEMNWTPVQIVHRED
jgi:hypothetical protein